MEDGSTLSLLTPYPINSIYMAETETSPASIFGGEWEKIEKRFLLGHGTGNTLGQTGGEESHTLISGEIPSSFLIPYASASGDRNPCISAAAIDLTGSSTQNIWININDVGGGSHNNMPPYYVVNIWKRVA